MEVSLGMVLRTIFTKELCTVLNNNPVMVFELVTYRVNRAKVRQQQEFFGIIFNHVKIAGNDLFTRYMIVLLDPAGLPITIVR
jgi:hypothetical protein